MEEDSLENPDETVSDYNILTQGMNDQKEKIVLGEEFHKEIDEFLTKAREVYFEGVKISDVSKDLLLTLNFGQI